MIWMIRKEGNRYQTNIIPGWWWLQIMVMSDRPISPARIMLWAVITCRGENREKRNCSRFLPPRLDGKVWWCLLTRLAAEFWLKSRPALNCLRINAWAFHIFVGGHHVIPATNKASIFIKHPPALWNMSSSKIREWWLCLYAVTAIWTG